MSNHVCQSPSSDEDSGEDQDNPSGQGRAPKEHYVGLIKFNHSVEVHRLHATTRRLNRLSQFVKPSPPGAEERPSVTALNAACEVEDEMETFLEDALAKLDGISRKLDQRVDVLSECVLKGDEWYHGGNMLWLDVDEFKEALAQASIPDARAFRLHVEQAVSSMSPQDLARLADTYSCRARESLRFNILASIAYLRRFGAKGTYHAFHLLVFFSTHKWGADERCPPVRRARPGNHPMGVAWKLFARLIGSGPDKQVEIQGYREKAWLEESGEIAMSDWKLPGYWDFCAAYRTMKKGEFQSSGCSCAMQRSFAERRRDWLREQAVEEVKGKLNQFAPPDLPVELMDIILDLALQEEGVSDG